MAISLQIPTMNAKMAPMLHKAMPNQNLHRQYVSCRLPIDQVAAMHKKNKANFYDLLSLGSENINYVDLCDIKKAYRSVDRQLHPDVCPPSAKEESTRKFIELQKAYEMLLDPISRQMYDYQLGLGVDGFSMEMKRSMFPREVWEDQLRGLHMRSQTRRERKNCRSSV